MNMSSENFVVIVNSAHFFSNLSSITMHSGKFYSLQISFCIVLFSTMAGFVMAQDKDTTSTPRVNLISPYHTIETHLAFLQPENYEPDSSAAVFGFEGREIARRLAIQLKQVLDANGLYVDTDRIPVDPNYEDSTSGLQRYILFPARLPEIYLEKMGTVWYYSNETARVLPQLHRKYYPLGADWLVQLFPRVGQNQFLGLYVWQYIGAALLFGLLALAHFALSWLIPGFIRRLLRNRTWSEFLPEQFLRKPAKYFSILILIQVSRLFIPMLQLPVIINEYLIPAIHLAGILILVLIGLSLNKIFVFYFKRLTSRTANKMDDQLVPILNRTIQGVIVLAGLFQALTLLNVNVTALLAGISIGGIALALAAQDTVKNLIGSATIFVDQPFQVGDWIEGSGFAGTVTEVGFRTTRIQPIDTSVITVPNGQIMNMSITNLGARSSRLFATTLGVTYDTPPDLLELFLQGLEKIILTHPQTRNDPYYVRLRDLGASSLDIMFRTWINTGSFAEEVKVREELIFSILRLAERLGVSFAFPSTSVYLESTPVHPLKNDKTVREGNEQIDAFIKDYKTWLEKR